jgi:tRNA threonylcarbamoyladenosine biosynthesis protein TsaB
MIALAVDTAADTGSIALASFSPDGTIQILEEKRLDASGGFGQTLFGELEALLARQKVRLADIDLYAAASGPGSFTGVRVGLAAIKGLAEVANKPAVGISNLAALAQFGSAEMRAPIIDARRGEVFAALYGVNNEEIIPASVLPLAEFQKLVGDRTVEYISATPELAATIARLAIQRYLAHDPCDPATIEANYVRRSDAEITATSSGTRL